MIRKLTIPFENIETNGCSLPKSTEITISFDSEDTAEANQEFNSRPIRIILEMNSTQQTPQTESCHRINSNKPRLTFRETEVLNLVGQGYGSKQIAEQLSRSINTITTHRQRIIEKLGVKNTAEAVCLMQFLTSENMQLE